MTAETLYVCGDEVVVSAVPSDLFGELLLTQLVEGVELPAEDLVVSETCTGQLDPHDDGSVRNHHGYRAELNLQVLWQLLAARITRVLEKEGEVKMGRA